MSQTTGFGTKRVCLTNCCVFCYKNAICFYANSIRFWWKRQIALIYVRPILTFLKLCNFHLIVCQFIYAKQTNNPSTEKSNVYLQLAYMNPPFFEVQICKNLSSTLAMQVFRVVFSCFDYKCRPLLKVN